MTAPSKKQYIALVLTFLLLCFKALGQEFPLQHFTIEDGLPSNTAYHIYRDSKGYLWICTNKGVARYNGLKFEHFTTFSGLADNEIFSVVEDKANRLWFASYNGAFSYFKNDTFHNADNTPYLKHSRRQSAIRRMFPQKDGSIIFSFFDARYLCEFSDNRWKLIDLQNNSRETSIDEINHPAQLMSEIFYAEKLGNERYKIIMDSQVSIIEGSNPVKFLNRTSFFSKCGIVKTANSAQNQNFLLYSDNNCIYSKDLEYVSSFPGGMQKGARVITSYISEDGNRFHATNRGLFVNDSLCLLRDRNITGITQDLEGNYWISTLDQGIYLLAKHFLASHVYRDVYQNEVVTAQEVNGKLFLGLADCNLYRVDGGRTRCLFKGGNSDYTQQGKPLFFVDNDATLYYFRGYQVTTNPLFHAAWVWNTVVKNVLKQPSTHKQYRFNSYYPVRVLKKLIKYDNKLYVNFGFYISAIDLNDYALGDLGKNDLLLYKSERIFAMAMSSQGILWASTLDSLYKIVGAKSTTVHEYSGAAFKNFEFVGQFLVGYTHDNRLLVYEATKDRVKKHVIARECVWDNLYKIDSSHMLIATNGPYYMLSLHAGDTAAPFSFAAVENPLIPSHAEMIYVGANDCYFFKDGNITKVGKSELLEKTAPPVLYFTSIKTSRQVRRIEGDIQLPYSEAGNILIAFSTISMSGRNLTYQYCIGSKSGYDRWIDFTGDINLANRSYGTYTIKVRAKTVSSDFSTPIGFTLTVLRPFWATWWFISSIICAAGLLVWVIVRKRITIQMKKKEREHENHVRFIRSEYKAMNALMNPHFVFNSINNVQSLVNNHDVMNATEYLGIFADLLRQNMHNISNDSISLQKEIDLVENYLLLEKLRFEDQLSYSINIADNMFLSDIMVPPLLLQPLVENAIKHGILPLKSKGKQGYVHINIYEHEDTLRIEVKDNGIGLAKAKEKRSLHESYGLGNIRNRVKQLSIIQGKEILFDLIEIVDADGVSQGTQATICMPLN